MNFEPVELTFGSPRMLMIQSYIGITLSLIKSFIWLPETCFITKILANELFSDVKKNRKFRILFTVSSLTFFKVPHEQCEFVLQMKTKYNIIFTIIVEDVFGFL